MNKMLQIRKEYGKPFVEVISDFGSKGFSQAETARTLGFDVTQFKRLVRRFGVRDKFPQSKKELNARCRSVGAHTDRNVLHWCSRPVVVNGLEYFPGEPTYHYIKAKEKEAYV